MAEQENSVLLDEELEKTYPKRFNYPRQKILLLVNFLIFFPNLAFFILNSYSWGRAVSRCEEKLSTYSPAIRSFTEKTIQFDGTFTSHSVFKGKPNPELDKAWDSITPIKYIPLSADEVRRLGKDPVTAVQFPPETRLPDKPYAGLVEVFHQLHCLNTVRQYLDVANYTIHFPLSDRENRYHVDHCIDILRQLIMCTADVGVVTLNWVTFMDHPTPDFSTNHVCRDFDQISQWNDEHALGYEGSPFRKTDDIIQLDHYP